MRQRTPNCSAILPPLSSMIGSVTDVVLRVLAFSSIVCGELATSEAAREVVAPWLSFRTEPSKSRQITPRNRI
jgi:hypothetical protein